MNENNRQVVFVFEYSALFNAWERAIAIAKEEGIDIAIVNQAARKNRENESAEIFEHADAVYFAGTRYFPNFENLAALCGKARYTLPSGMDAVTALGDRDEPALRRMDAYFTSGSARDFVNAARFMLHKAGFLPEAPPEPEPPLLCGIYHPEAKTPFQNLAGYLSWKRETMKSVDAAHFAAVCFPRMWLLSEDMELIHAVIAPLEKNGLHPLLIFCDGDLALSFGKISPHPMDGILSECGLNLAAVWSLLSASMDGDGAADPFQAYGAPVFQILRNYNQTVEEWKASSEGLSAMAICYGLTRPEMLGCIEPTLLACNKDAVKEGMPGKAYKAVPVPERIDHLSRRTARWHRLRMLPNSEKRVAVMLHQSPCKGVEATIASAAGLNAAESAVAILRRLKVEGYKVDDIPADGRDLMDRIFAKKAISEFRWTNVEEIEAKGGVIARIYREDYLRDFEKLPDAVQKRVNEGWDPFPGQAMVGDKETERPYLLITGIWFGNILIIVDPKRGCYGPKCDGEVCRILHEPDIPPTHHWLAVFWYLQREVDALVSLGTGSPLEYLPGKRAALGKDCYPEISLGTLPLVYPYIVSATGLGLMAKRRGRGVLIDYLTPAIARVADDSGAWAEMESLHAQYCAAREVNDGRRLANIMDSLRELLVKANLLEPESSDENLRIRIEELPGLVERLRKRFSGKRAHVFGKVPEADDVKLYIDEAAGYGIRDVNGVALSEALEKTSVEMDRLIAALSARFIPPGPSGCLSRGKTDILPTGRNFYGTDLRAVPTRAAWAIGSEMGRMILRKYLKEEGAFPRSIAVTLWSSDVFRADGELVSQGLWLTGCRPVWEAGSDRVSGIELIPSDELNMEDDVGVVIPRPRVDIVIQMSGIVRDTLPGIYQMLDEAVEKAAARNEPEEVNYIRANVERRVNELKDIMSDIDIPSLHRLARCRVFSSKPGSYGTGIGLAVDAAAWETDKDLAEAYVNWTGFAYGKGLEGVQPIQGNETASLREYANLMGKIDVAYQKAIGPEYDALSSGSYSDFQGGMAAVNRAAGKGTARMYWGDSSDGEHPDIRALDQEISESLFSRLLNPEWIEQRRLDGSKGAHGVSGMVNTLFHWSANARVVTKEEFDAVWRVYIADEKNRLWLQSENIYALEEITRRLLEAASRNMWSADEDKLEELRNVMLSIEGDLEERMGPVKGEFQGGAVDIKRRGDVEKWHYAFTLDSVN